MALPEIKSVADLKGKTVGVIRLGSSTDFALRYLMQKQGFNAEKDVNILQLGGMPELGNLPQWRNSPECFNRGSSSDLTWIPDRSIRE